MDKLTLQNPMLMTDGYKLDHRRQYPEGTEIVYSNWTARGSRIPEITKVNFLGLQYFLQEYMVDRMIDGFFDRPLDHVLREYRDFVLSYLGPNSVGVDHIADLHKLKYIPLVFHALPEGTAVPLRVPMFTVNNTIKEFFWLTNYFETLASQIIWPGCTSATRAVRLKKMLDEKAKLSGADPSFTQWQGHDFSMRGMGGLEASVLSGMGHLVAFTGTDTIPAINAANYYYPDPTSAGNGLIGGSVPATEHSVMCAGGKDSETQTIERLLDLYPSGIVSVVSDTWDLWHVVTIILPNLTDKIMRRNGKLVIRPDSGDPVKIICDDPDATYGTPASKGLIRLLYENFGGTKNAAGYLELDPHIGAIYGDAITYERAQEICTRLMTAGFASTNIVFGVGSYTYQLVTRDTFGFAMKATYCVVKGEERNLFKKPVTDTGEKYSATGLLSVVHHHDGMRCIENASDDQMKASLLRQVWANGYFVKDHKMSFAQVREAAAV